MLHIVPDKDKVDYAHSLFDSIKSLIEIDDFNNLSDHDLDIVVTALKLTYECLKGVMNFRQSRQTW